MTYAFYYFLSSFLWVYVYAQSVGNTAKACNITDYLSYITFAPFFYVCEGESGSMLFDSTSEYLITQASNKSLLTSNTTTATNTTATNTTAGGATNGTTVGNNSTTNGTTGGFNSTTNSTAGGFNGTTNGSQAELPEFRPPGLFLARAFSTGSLSGGGTNSSSSNTTLKACSFCKATSCKTLLYLLLNLQRPNCDVSLSNGTSVPLGTYIKEVSIGCQNLMNSTVCSSYGNASSSPFGSLTNSTT